MWILTVRGWAKQTEQVIQIIFNLTVDKRNNNDDDDGGVEEKKILYIFLIYQRCIITGLQHSTNK